MSRDYVLQPFHAATPLQIDYSRELNPQQLAAVTAPPGPSLVIAGAGSGKTRTLIYRVAFLLEQGIPPERILLLTFTNKAAREMMRRVADLLGQELAELWGGTFHSIGNRVLRQHAGALGFGRDFSILDREDARHLISDCLGQSSVDTTLRRFPKAEVLGEIFSLAVNTGKTVPDILLQHFPHFEGLEKEVDLLRTAYEARKRSANALDFDDLLVLWLRLLQEDADVRELFQRRFQFILVDEYQDTNRLQGELIDLLAARHRNVMVVGDDAQSIYAWRGANYENILHFPDRYPGTAVYKIETNYRSTPEILSVANSVIAANTRQFAKQLSPERKSGMRPSLVACADSGQQAGFVAQRALELRDEGVSLNRMAVLYRSHFHALELQLELTRRNIPFTITSGIRFFEQAHIKDVAAHLRLVANPRDEICFKRVTQLLPGIGAKGAAKLWEIFSSQVAPPPPPAAEKPGPASPAPADATLAARLQRCADKVPKRAAVAWAQFVATVSQLEAKDVRDNPAKMIRLVIEAGYEDYLKENHDNFRPRLDDLEQIAIFAQQFETVDDFLSHLALLSNLEAESEQTPVKDDERMRLSTIHQAKGLEFDVVFVIMLCDGLFPVARALEVPDGEEEERRLMYVAITRARNELYLSYPIFRPVYGGGGSGIQEPSRFIRDIPPELVETWNLKGW